LKGNSMQEAKSKRFRRRVVVVFAVLAVLVAAAAWFLLWVAPRIWEGLLFGPYAGRPYTAALPSIPNSTLRLAADTQAELYDVPDTSAPVLVLRRGGAVQWSRLLLPERVLSDGTNETAAVREARFQKAIVSASAIRLRFTCDWDWGGQEAGLIYLHPDYSFDHFGISW
jgi:hypothetical protein